MSNMAVVGYDVEGNEVYGEVMGDLDGEVMGARRRRAAGRSIAIPPKAAWRSQLAPGVIQPDEGMVPLTLVGQAGAPPGQFSSALQTLTFQGQLQKPFRPERLRCSTWAPICNKRTLTDGTLSSSACPARSVLGSRAKQRSPACSFARW